MASKNQSWRFLASAVSVILFGGLVSGVGGQDFAKEIQAVSPLLEWKNIGPNLGGRSIAVGGSTKRLNEYYFGATGGGLWKTTSGGTEWFPVTDGHIGSASVGAIAVCQAYPNVVYIGTGEGQFRGTMSMGDGVYKTPDGGETWVHLGLGSSTGQTAISRVRVHPTDCDTVFVASMGDPWGPNEERGVYRSKDGGKSWDRVLYRNAETGAAEINFDPNNPDVLYATLWDMERRPWVANSGGPDSGLFKSVDGGDSWVELTDRLPLPEGRIGKMGVSVSGADSSRVYTLVEHHAGGLFRSDDGGSTWTQVNDERKLIDRAEYYIRVFADPVDLERVYVNTGSGFYMSDDGGKTYEKIPVPHGDNHDLWIDPTDNNRMIQSNDGGANVTVNGAETWTAQDYPTAQMYHVTTTGGFPFSVCGAQQDRTSVCLPVDGQGEYLYKAAAGEQGYLVFDPVNNDISIGGQQRGWMKRLDRSVGQRKAIDVWPDSKQGLPPDQIRERFPWTFPICLSPQEPGVVFVASQYVWRSEDYGESWTRISPDLSYADPTTVIGEQSIIPNQNSQDYYATIFALAVSPHDARTLWAGSDDGLIHITQDGGESWQNITPLGLPKDSRVSFIHASSHNPGKAYVAVERYKMQDLGVYVYKTGNFGQDWKLITRGVRDGHYARAVIEDPVRSEMLFLGTEHGPYVSLNDGDDWQPLSLNLPDVQVPDLTIRENTLAIATYGRSFWVLDDISPLRELTPGLLEQDVVLFGVSDAIRTRSEPTEFYRRRQLPNLNNAAIRFHLKKPVDKILIEIFTADGSPVWSYSDEELRSAGSHEVNWDLRYPEAEGFEGLRIRGGSTKGPVALPGTYEVRLIAAGVEKSVPLVIQRDPRLTSVSQADLEEQFQLAVRIHNRLDEALAAVREIRALKETVKDDALIDRLNEIEGKIYEGRARSPSGVLQFGVKLVNKLGILHERTLWSADGRPTQQTYQVFEKLSAELDVQLGALREIKGQIDS